MYFDTRQLINIKPYLFFNAIFEDNFSMKMHAHKTLEILYVAAGEIVMEVMRDGTKDLVNVLQRQFIILKPNVPHNILPQQQNTTANVLNIEFECLSQLYKIDDLFFMNGFTASFPQAERLYTTFSDILLFNDTGGFLEALNSLQDILRIDFSEEQFELAYSLELSRLILTLLRCEQIKSQYNEGNIYINKALAYMQKNMHRDISLNEISRATGCSPAYLERIFNKHYDATVAKKLNDLRIQRAKHLLGDFSLQVKGIGKSVGYNSVKSFSNNFKKATGLTPNEYRRQEKLNYNSMHAYDPSYFDEKFNSLQLADGDIPPDSVPPTDGNG